MPSIWDDIKKTVKEGVSVAAEKTEELRKIGKVKVDIISLKRNLENNYKDLGTEVYDHLAAKNKTAVNQLPRIKELVSTIDGLKESLGQKDEEIEQIKLEAAAKKTASSNKPAVGSQKKK